MSDSAPAKIFVFAPEVSGEIGSPLQPLITAGCEIVQGNASWLTPLGQNESEMKAFAAGADALLGTSIRSSPITSAIMESSNRLRIVAKYTVGVDDVDVEAATRLGVLVTHAPTEANWGGVAEGVIAMMLAVLKKVRERDNVIKSGNWRDASLEGTYIGHRMQDDFSGITVGIIGLGRIGRRVCDLLSPWRVRILACDPYVEKARFALHSAVESSLDTLLSQSDVVSIHCDLNETSRNLIDATALSRMKPSALLINAARGGIVNETDLAAALVNNVIASAALDVFAVEPLSKDSPLLHLGDKVLLSAHMVTSNKGSGIGPGAIWAADYVTRALRGTLPDHIVNPEVIPTWTQRFGGRNLLG